MKYLSMGEVISAGTEFMGHNGFIQMKSLLF